MAAPFLEHNPLRVEINHDCLVSVLINSTGPTIAGRVGSVRSVSDSDL
jgi:hypothetical protein